MISKKLNQIKRDDLLGLIGRVRENKRFECKREIPRGDKGRLKLLAGVSALANTEGGDFLIGAATEQGLVTAVDGIEVADPDQHKQAIEQQLAAQIEPPVAGIDIQEVESVDGRWAFVVRVPRSWIGPHREKLYNDFYVRTSTSTLALGVSELRSAFGLRESGTERIEAFRRERLCCASLSATIADATTAFTRSASSALTAELRICVSISSASASWSTRRWKLQKRRTRVWQSSPIVSSATRMKTCSPPSKQR